MKKNAMWEHRKSLVKTKELGEMLVEKVLGGHDLVEKKQKREGGIIHADKGKGTWPVCRDRRPGCPCKKRRQKKTWEPLGERAAVEEAAGKGGGKKELVGRPGKKNEDDLIVWDIWEQKKLASEEGPRPGQAPG